MRANRAESRFAVAAKLRAAVFAAAALAAACSLFSISRQSAFATEPVPQRPTAKQAAAKPAANANLAAKPEAAPDGAELFAREWLPNDSRAHGGDGLGPVFNDSSCIACHNQGGVGGAGPASKNVDIITAFSISVNDAPPQFVPPPQTLPQGLFNLAFGGLAPPVPVQPTANAKPVAAPRKPTTAERKLAKERAKKELMKIHPGFATARSVVLHHFGTDPKYQQWRQGVFSGQPSNPFMDTLAEPAAVAPVTTTDVPPPTVASGNLTVTVEGGQTVTNPNTPAKDVESDLAPPAGPTIASAPPITQQVATNSEAAILQNEVQMKHSGTFNTTFQTGNVQISHSQRNPIALFGIGLIDAIPEKTIVDLAKAEHEKYPDVAGRPAKQKDGKIGRFGWKAQKPSLEDFALTACAVELGLNVPGHEQAGVPLKPNYKAPGLDMNKAECDALVSYLRNLPAPTERKPATAQEAATISAGHKLFASVGCANCHVEKVGVVSGLYSDLLLHDMGPELGDSGNYGVFTPDAPEEEQDDSPMAVAPAGGLAPFAGPGQPVQQFQAKMTPQQLAKLVGALRQEWRTAPLWGVRDSGPYLHDGRADTLEQAIAFHGGQGASSALKFFQLKPGERNQVTVFLKSLTAPEPTAKTVRLAAR